MLGSCFSEHIGKRLAECRFSICSNPTGILFNPLSIAQVLGRLMEGTRYAAGDLFKHDGLWKSYDHHSDFDEADRTSCLKKINVSFSEAKKALDTIDWLIITFGTAFAYTLVSENRIVANCHTQPQSLFSRSLISPDTIANEYSDLLQRIRNKHPGLSVVLTVSPIRHLRDDPHENSVSKAHLLAATYALEQRFGWVHYFPSYEIMMDDLRDYRFYEKDMAHPSETAIEYTWDEFKRACICGESVDFIDSYDRIKTAMHHRIRNAESRSAEAFALKQVEDIRVLERKYGIALKEEKRYFLAMTK
jgi:hypothetical protein